MDKKRLIIMAIFTVIVIGLGYLMYRVFFAPPSVKPSITTQPPVTVEPGTLPSAGAGAALPTGQQPTTLPTAGQAIPSAGAQAQAQPIVKKLVDNSVLNPQVDQQGRLNLYNQKDGKFYRIGADGKAELLSDQVFYQVQTVNWSPKNEEAILEYPDGSNIYYNFATKKQVTLPKHWEQFSFSSLGDKVAAKSIALAPENRWVVTANPDGSEVELIEPMGDNADKVKIDWSPNQQIIATSLTGASLGATRQEVLFVGLNGENFKSITVEGRGITSQWSTTGSKLLYSVYSARSSFKPELWIVNASGDEIGTGRKLLEVNTWAEKCAFADDRYVYCAVPNTMQSGAGFAPTVADATPDTIYRIDTQTGLRSPVKTDGTHTIDSLLIGEGGDKLYFTDKGQSGLFEVAL